MSCPVFFACYVILYGILLDVHVYAQIFMSYLHSHLSYAVLWKGEHHCA